MFITPRQFLSSRAKRGICTSPIVLARLVRVMGGRLDIRVVLPDRTVRCRTNDRTGHPYLLDRVVNYFAPQRAAVRVRPWC
jgi:hypothetical protein